MVYKQQITVQSHGNTPSYINITEEVKKQYNKAIYKMESVQ